jgi:hypothetical protein
MIAKRNIKKQSFENTPYSYYNHPLLCADEEDYSLLDKSMTNLQKFHNPNEYINYNWPIKGDWTEGTKMMWYPKFHRREKYKLPVNEYSIEEYENVLIKIHTFTVKNCEATKVEVMNHIDGPYTANKIYPLLNFEGKSWQHFMQDCIPILMFGLDFLRENPDVDLLVYQPHTWNTNTFFEVMKYFNLSNHVIFIPYSVEMYISAKFLYNFEARPMIPVCWWNNWFYEKANDIFNTSKQNKNVILVERKGTRTIENFGEIEQIMKNYSTTNNLNFVKVNPNELPPDEVFNLFNNAHTVLSPNGGASFHILFCNKNVKFIETAFVDWSYILYNIASAIKCKYYVMPIRGHNNTPSFKLNPNKLIKILND